jgi:predicted DNA-binding transcriptional regulator AlpA
MSHPSKQTRDMFAVFCDALEGADRVIVETKNALGEMDAHYLHAPELSKAIQDHKRIQDQLDWVTTLLTPDDVAAWLRISKRQIHNLIRDRDFPPPIKLGRTTLWRPMDVENYVDALAKAVNDQRERANG